MIPRIKWLSLLLMLCALPHGAGAASVKGVRVGLHGDTIRMVFDIEDIKSYRAFVMDNPYRMAVDLPAFDWKVTKISKPAGTGVSGIRQGVLDSSISRIVIDLSQPVSIRSSTILPGSGAQGDRLVIDFAKIAPDAFRAEKGKIFGQLKSATPVPPPEQKIEPPKTVRDDARPAVPSPRHVDNKPEPSALPASGEKPLIVIDPGHGGIDPGALGANGVFEKNVALGMARELKKQLEGTGRYRVLLTRDGDTFLKLHERVEFARARHASLFVSLHADSINRAGVEGASIYTLSDKASDAQTEKLAARENRADLIGGLDVQDPDQDVATILVDLVMRDNINQSRFFANTVVGDMRQGGIKLLENTHRSAGFAVLKAPDIPSVLIELGFMTSRQESNLLSSDAYREKVSRALLAGINAYFDRIDRQ